MKFLAPRGKSASAFTFSFGGHRTLTVLVVTTLLFVAACVYFVNSVVLTPGSDPAYQSQAESQAQLIKFNTSLLKQARDFSANANNTALPAGRTNPFSS